jgi:hypothetical protein
VADGAAGLLRRLAGDGHDLDDLLGAEGGGGSGPVLIAEDILDEGQQFRLGGAFLLSVVEGGEGLQPAIPPQPDGHAGESQLPRHGRDAGLGSESQEDGGPADQALAGGLALVQALQ